MRLRIAQHPDVLLRVFLVWPWLACACTVIPEVRGPSDEADADHMDATEQSGSARMAGTDAGARNAAMDASRSSAADASSVPGSAAQAGAPAAAPRKRAHDDRVFMVDPTQLPFEALPSPTVDSDRWSGILEGAGYRIEVPKRWNGVLVMYAHGYAGSGSQLRITMPSIRRYLLEHDYAWAASSFSKNFYDVRAGVEDSNALALAFSRLAAEHGRPLGEPTKRYVIGHSMGGHIAAAAVEKEVIATAVHKVRYAAALPMCGALADTEFFNYVAAYQFGAQQLAQTQVALTQSDFAMVRSQTQNALFSEFPSATTALGDKLRYLVRGLTGGARPVFELGFASKQSQEMAWSNFGLDGTIAGILDRSSLDTRHFIYDLDSDDEERRFNQQVYRAKPDPESNPPRDDGLRWIPRINGEIDVPVITLHTLGDLYIPFKMEQIYRQRIDTRGNRDRLVQRIIRSVGHCEFSLAEQAEAFADLARWEQEGAKPEGDEVLDAAIVQKPDYGCKFTRTIYAAVEPSGMLATARAMIPPCATVP